MALKESLLSPQEREQAKQLWEELMFAPSAICLELARQALREAPINVQGAVMKANTALIVAGRQADPLKTPFDE